MTPLNKYLSEAKERHGKVHAVQGALIDWKNLELVVQDAGVLLHLVHILIEQRNREINSDIIKMTVEQAARHLEVAKLQVERDDRQLEYYIPKGGE